MNRYFRPRDFRPEQELRLLTLSDIEHVSEDGISETGRYLGSGWDHRCPRCKSINRIVSPLAYCNACDWDEASDLD
jgi:hypothetical protein